MQNNYYDIAYNNLLFLEHTFQTEFYNDISIQCQQVAEKFLKSIIEEIYSSQDNSIDKLLHSHNLRALFDSIHTLIPDFILNRGELSMLKDYYYDAKYPGDNFVTVTREECKECIKTLYDVVEQVNAFREKNNLSYYKIERKNLNTSSSLKQLNEF